MDVTLIDVGVIVNVLEPFETTIDAWLAVTLIVAKEVLPFDNGPVTFSVVLETNPVFEVPPSNPGYALFAAVILIATALSTCVEPVTLIVLLAVIVFESTEVLACIVPVNTDVLACIAPVNTDVLAVNVPVRTDVLACTVLTVTDVPEISVAITFGADINVDTLNVPELDPVIETVEILELTVTLA